MRLGPRVAPPPGPGPTRYKMPAHQHIRPIVLAIVACVAPALAPLGAARAQAGTATAPVTPPAPTVVLPQVAARAITLPDAQQLADRNAPQAVQARGQIRTANASRKAAYAAFIPSL